MLKAFEPSDGALGRFAALGLNSFPLLSLQVRRQSMILHINGFLLNTTIPTKELS